MNKLEAQAQERVVKWWAEMHERLGIKFEGALIHIPNAGKRGMIGGAGMKRAGLRAGAPDLFLFVARGDFHGLAIEMKAPDGKRSVAQTVFLDQLRLFDYAVATCHSSELAVMLIEDYLRNGTLIASLQKS